MSQRIQPMTIKLNVQPHNNHLNPMKHNLRPSAMTQHRFNLLFFVQILSSLSENKKCNGIASHERNLSRWKFSVMSFFNFF